MPRPWRSLLAARVLATSLAAFGLLAIPQPVAACTGGVDVWWAIEHSSGDVLIGRVTAVKTFEDYSTVLDLDVEQVVRGPDRATAQVRGGMGAVCDQSAEVGETALVLEHVRDDDLFALPLFFILGGPGGYSRGRIEAALARLPETDSAGSAAPAGLPFGPLLAIVAGALGGTLGWRRTPRRNQRRPT